MGGSGSTTTKPVPAPRRGRKPKAPSASDKLQNVFVAPTRSGETLPKWAVLLKNEFFVGLEEGESFSRRVCSPCGTKVRNCPEKLHGDAFANQRRTEHAN